MQISFLLNQWPKAERKIIQHIHESKHVIIFDNSLWLLVLPDNSATRRSKEGEVLRKKCMKCRYKGDIYSVRLSPASPSLTDHSVGIRAIFVQYAYPQPRLD